MPLITGRCIWITGASSGIGKALATKLCDQGNFVIVSARSKSVLQKMVVGASGRMSALAMDLATDGESLAGYANSLAEVTDYIDVVICCAGICEYEDALQFEPQRYRRVMETNFLGVGNTLHLALPLLKKSIVTPQFVAIGSLSALLPFPRAEAYGASKAALEYFMTSLQCDLVHTPLKVSLVRPGFMRTPMTANNDFAMPFILEVEDATNIIINGIAKQKRVIDFPRRLSIPLRLLALLPVLWRRGIAPRISRVTRKSWKD